MTLTLLATSTSGKAIAYRDRKRGWWALSVVYPLLPFAGIAAHAWSGWPGALALPLLISYGLLPLLDAIIGEDTNNPPEEVVPQLDADRYYRWLTWGTVPLHFVALIGCAWWAGTQAMPWWAVAVLAYVAGAGSGLGINTGHELGHKATRIEQWLARLVLAVPAYGHFTVEHGRGHHRWVATPHDHASARMGESIYRFALREVPGGIRRAWALEKERLGARGCCAWSAQNTMLQSYAVTLWLQGALVLAWGVAMLPFLLIHNLVAWWQLTSANYVEHYGLLRRELADSTAESPRSQANVALPLCLTPTGGGRLGPASGRYEPPQPHHSWNTNHLVTNLVLFHLQRHSDHHAHPSRRYQSLRHFEHLPQLPSGYFGMFPLAYVPPLWFRVMDPRLLALPDVQGDLSKVNLDPRLRAART